MNSPNAALLINLLGFTVGIALYALLGFMVGRRRPGKTGTVDRLLLATSGLGLLWNIGELFLFLQKDFNTSAPSPILIAASYSALGFLPSVVVHSAQAESGKAPWLKYAAYGLSIFAALLNFQSAIFSGRAPSDLGLQALTYGAVALAAGLLIFNFRQTIENKTIWASALLVFAVSALHLYSEREGSSWVVELVAHQSSLPLALAILYQNYRFAFADLFLKRAFSLILLAIVAFGLYVFVAAPLLRYHETHDRDDVAAVSLILTLWIATALIYPALHKFGVWIVDRAILKRVDYAELQLDLAKEIERLDSIAAILDHVCARLASALTSEKAGWTELSAAEEDAKFAPLDFTPDKATLIIPAAESPNYKISLSEFQGGRRLLSDETAMLEGVALLTARRIDALRVTQERYEQVFREQTFSKLAAEAQLTALRSQINPHFLFNALTTIGYLIQTAPEKAFQTLLHLTQLLRTVLSSAGEFCTLGEEIKLIENYLDIERARFEERLSVRIDLPEELGHIRVPSLILQPLVENAIKHGISENKNGGELRITAELIHRDAGDFLALSVYDTGSGPTGKNVIASTGVGLQNIRDRLASYYGDKAEFRISIDPAEGSRAEATFPVKGLKS